jgi:hypothetical protein
MPIGERHLLDKIIRRNTRCIGAHLSGHVQRISYLNALAKKVCVRTTSE